MTNLQLIQKRIDLIDPLLSEVAALQAISKVRFTMDSTDYEKYSEYDCKLISEKVAIWKRNTSEIVSRICGESNSYLIDFNSNWSTPSTQYNFKSEMTKTLERAKRDLKLLLEIEKLQEEANADINKIRVNKRIPVSTSKTPKIFISHKKEDQHYADALVNLINFIIGPDGDKIFCSSIPGYGIRQSRDIMDELKAQFDNHEIFMIIIHSPRYYNSAVCLNEMGASWVLGTKFSSFMTKDCTYDQLRGVIGKEKICINLNDDSDMLNAHLNDFKNDLLSFFGAKAIDENKWEHARSRFIKEVTRLVP